MVRKDDSLNKQPNKTKIIRRRQKLFLVTTKKPFLIRKGKMKTVNICHRDSNLEIISKLMNSVALQYNCRINYNAKENTINFHAAYPAS